MSLKTNLILTPVIDHLFLLLEDTLCITLQNGLVWLIGVLHRNGLWEFSQHPLLEGLQPFVVMATTDKLFVLEWRKEKGEVLLMLLVRIFTRK